MRVQFDPEVFNTPSAFHVLDQLFRFFETERHQWDTRPIGNGLGWAAESVFDSPWLQEQSRTVLSIREFLEKIFTVSGYATPHKLVLLVKGGSDVLDRAERTVSVAHAHPVLARPAYVFVENQFSDVRFLTRVLRAFDAWSGLEGFFKEKFIEWEHAGGTGQIKDMVAQRMEDPAIIPARILVVRDGDRTPEGLSEETKKSIERLRQWCAETGVKLHVLTKRDSENYLPKRLLPQQRTDSVKVGKRYEDLSPTEQDVFDMKKGFGGKVGEAFDQDISRQEFEQVCQSHPAELEALVQQFWELL